jgi:3',5'-cyclic AMP phosphodiesterase CpdA
MNGRQRTPLAAAVLAAASLAACGGGGGGGGGAGPAPEITFQIVAAGDIASCGSAPASASAAAKTAALVTAQDVVVLTLGDNAYESGTPSEFASCFHPTWGAFRDRTRPNPGNHDYFTPGAEGYYSYFGALAGPDRRGYYSFDYGGWHFISLNVMVDVSAQSAQYQWLAADLAASRDTLCTIAYWHYPLFNSGATYGGSPQMKPFFDALYNAGVEMVLSGHDHLYERFAPQTANGVVDTARGVRQFVVGTGGRDLYKLGPPQPNSEVRIEGTHGVLRLTLGQGNYRWQFVPVGGGAALDAGSGTCHR